MERRDQQLQVRLICLVLGLVTFGVFCQVLNNDFVDFDDYYYVRLNPFIKNGVTPSALVWAFTHGYSCNWHPLTWISHMIDCQIYGINHPGGHHLTSLLFHIANAVLLFVVLRRMTGALWRSALVAALFAWHPLHVESVAWISERKDVLSTLFWLLTMLAYVNYVNAIKAQDPRSKIHYRWTVAWFAMGLMAKPMLVTLPFVLLLLDYWPLNRISNLKFEISNVKDPRPPSPWTPLVKEKLPMMALSVVSSIVTFLVQDKSGAVIDMDRSPFVQRIANALLAYVGYLGKMVWPARLAIFYPIPAILPPLQVFGAFLLLALITAAAIKLRQSRPYVIVGWFWFLGTLVPVIGLVQVGSQAMADRYSYMALVGIFIALAWGASDLLGPARRNLGWAIAVPVLAACLFVTWKQVEYWRNTVTLFRRDVAVTKNNALGLVNLGRGLEDEGRPAEARDEFMIALKVRPGSPLVLDALGIHYSKLGDVTNAIRYYRAALQGQPTYEDVHYNLGNALASQGKYSEAAQEYAEAVSLNPDSPDALNNLGAMYVRAGRFEDALAEFKLALQYKPDYPEAQDQMASVLLKLGQPELALEHFAEAVRLKPDFEHAQDQLGLALARAGRISEAIPHFQMATNLEPQNAQACFNLAAAYSAVNYLDDALKTFAQVIKLRPKDAQARSRMAWILATTTIPGIRNGPEAVRLAEEANELTGYSQPDILGALDAAYAEAGRFDDAIKIAQKVQELAVAHDQKAIADQAAQRIELYRAGKPFRQ